MSKGILFPVAYFASICLVSVGFLLLFPLPSPEKVIGVCNCSQTQKCECSNKNCICRKAGVESE